MKNARGLSKKRGKHSTFTPLAGDIAKELNKSPLVTGISAGVVKTGVKSAHGNKSLKVIKNQTGALVLTVRDNISVMEVRVLGSDYDGIIKLLQAIASKKHLQFTLEDRTTGA